MRRSDDLDKLSLSWLVEVHGMKPFNTGLKNEEVIFSGVLTPSTVALFSQHVVGGTILLPGVGFVEMALACSPNHISAVTAVTFLRPC